MCPSVRWIILAALLAAGFPARAQQPSASPGRTVPTGEDVEQAVAQRYERAQQAYYAAFGPYYDGEYRKAVETLRAAGRSKAAFASAWSAPLVESAGGAGALLDELVVGGPQDLICVLAMQAECLYRMGDVTAALQQYDAALKLAVDQAAWMRRTAFPRAIEPAGPDAQRTITWGVRPSPMARFSEQFIPKRLGSREAIGKVGDTGPPAYYPEIVRCTALALRRRREILGPVAPQDPFTRTLLDAFGRPEASRSPWLRAWSRCLAGLAYALSGRTEQAEPLLQQALSLDGPCDHNLTPTILLELGRLAMEQGQQGQAGELFLQATVSAAAYGQLDLMAEAFRGAVLAHLFAARPGMYGPLTPATAWVRPRSRAVHAELLLLAAENLQTLGQMGAARNLLAETRQVVGDRDMRLGFLGARANFQAALLCASQGNPAGGAKDLELALAFQQTASPRLLQIRWADSLYTSGAVLPRTADAMFRAALRETTLGDWSVDPLESLAVRMTPQREALEHWFELSLNRRDFPKALEVADRIRRQRFYQTLPLGGRLQAFRWTLEGPEAALSPAAALQRRSLLDRYPNYARLARQAIEIRTALADLPLETDSKDLAQRLAELAKVSAAQELILREIALRREPAEFVFPPLRTTKEIQEQMPEGQLLLAYLHTGQGLATFAVTRTKCLSWPVENPEDLTRQIAALLQQLGLADKKPAVSSAVLGNPRWKATAATLLTQLTKPLPPDLWNATQELVVVPDGALWYLPLEVLQTGDGARAAPLISQRRVRYVPTASLANAAPFGRQPIRTTVVVVGKLAEAKDLGTATAIGEQLVRVLPEAALLDHLPASSGIFTATCGRLVVLGDVYSNATNPLAWSPAAVDRGKTGSTLEDWLALPWSSPAELVLPGFHTPAETGLRKPGRGDELFHAACGLMASGARSVLISRWTVGGQSTSDLVREYLQELPHSSAATAWQRSVQLARDNPVDPEAEPRVLKDGWDEKLTAGHPFFWAGYLLLDTGSEPTPP